MKIRKIEEDFAVVESGRILRRVNIQMLPRVKIGDHILIHAGFAIEKIDPDKAKQTLRIIDEIY
jgi:hydrogenase expression/formation protein HypC